LNKSFENIEYNEKYFKNMSMVVKVLESISFKGYFPNQNYKKLEYLIEKYQSTINDFLKELAKKSTNEFQTISVQRKNVSKFLLSFEKFHEEFQKSTYSHEEFFEELNIFEMKIFWTNETKSHLLDLNFFF
jgi:DNA repair ATPase RecN